MEYFINPSIARISVIEVPIIEDRIQCSLHFKKQGTKSNTVAVGGSVDYDAKFEQDDQR